jgi:hypothetical protein
MRNQTEGKTKNNTATFRPKEDESAIVMDSRIDHSSVEKHRKRIFEGRSKSIRTRRNNQQVQGDSVVNNISSIPTITN